MIWVNASWASGGALSLTKYHLGALWPLRRFCCQPGGQHLCRQGQQAVAGQVQVGEVLDVSGGLRWQRGELVVVQIEKSETGHIHEGFPGKGGEGIPVQTKLFQVEQPPETVRIQGGQRVERHPQEFQTGEVVEGFAWYPLDGCLLNPQLGRVHGEPDRHKRDLRIITNHAPKGERSEIVFTSKSFYTNHALRTFSQQSK